MRRVRLLAIIIFVAALLLEGGTRIQEKRNVDPTKPEIASTVDQLELSVEDAGDDSALLAKLRASDWKDGDLTDQIMVENKSYFVEKGVANIKYVVFDSNANCCEFTRPVVFTDYASPEFEVTQPLVYLKGSSAHFLDYVQATDCLDGDLTDSVKVAKTNVNNSESGVYPVKVQVVNSYGDVAEVTLNVWIRESSSREEIELSKYLVYIDKGQEFHPQNYVDSITDREGHSYDVNDSMDAVNSDGRRVCDVNVNGEVDINTPGCYQLTYTYVMDNSEGTAYQTVVVRE